MLLTFQQTFPVVLFLYLRGAESNAASNIAISRLLHELYDKNVRLESSQILNISLLMHRVLSVYVGFHHFSRFL